MKISHKKTVIEMAKEAGIEKLHIKREGQKHSILDLCYPELERFAALVRAELEWVDLTDDEIEEIGKSYFDEWSFGFARAVIAAFKEKNK